MEARFGVRVNRQTALMALCLCVALVVCSVGCANLCPRAKKQYTAVAARPEISPALARVALGSEVQFTVKMAGKPVKPVEWLVNGIPGGNDTLGTIGGGVYHSPAVAPASNELHVEAKLTKWGRSVFSTVIVGRADPTYLLVDRWTTDDRTEGKLDETHGICLDRSGNVIITDPTLGLVYRYTRDGKFLDEIGLGKGTGPEYFDGPRDAKVDPKGRIYVAEGNLNRIQRFDPDGKVVVSDEKAKLHRPHALDLDAQGRIYVADVDSKRVAVFDEDCNFLMGWPTPLIGPEKEVAPHGIGVDPNGDVFVVDYNGVCFKYTATGELLFSFAETSGSYHAMCTDKWGDVYFAARGGLRRGSYIDKYNNNGVHVLSIAIRREGRVHPVCMAVDAAGNVYSSGDKGVDILAPTSTEAIRGGIVFPGQ